MDDDPIYKRPWFYIAGWLVILLLVYGLQILRMGGIRANLLEIAFDLACVFPLLLILWIAFFAQFVLPVRTFLDRRKIFDRLITFLFGNHGPALFIENGNIKEHSGERLQNGPGVVWLDSASAAVTRTPVAIRQTIGPGVHFLEKFETIAGTVDLHPQFHKVGPMESDKPFEERKEDQPQEVWDQVQDRRKQVSAWTRDGIEVVPNITVIFRVATGFPKEGQPGSRFGFRTGVTKRDKQNQEQDKTAIRKAILGEGVNPNEKADSPRHRVKWNEFPAALAVDVWREYAAKFTLDELFSPTQSVPPAPPQLPQPTDEELDPLSQPIRVGANRDSMQDGLTRMVRELNMMMARAIDNLEGNKPDPSKKSVAPGPFRAEPDGKKEPKKKTALQVINDMVKARLTQPTVEVLDGQGRRAQGLVPSQEYSLLQKRGLEILNVSIGGLRFHPTIEQTIIRQWKAAWLVKARAESELIERKRIIVETKGHDEAVRQYANFLSKDLIQKRPVGLKETLKTLLLRTRTIIINNPQLRQRMSDEEQDLEEIIRWLEGNGT